MAEFETKYAEKETEVSNLTKELTTVKADLAKMKGGATEVVAVQEASITGKEKEKSPWDKVASEVAAQMIR